MAFPDFKINGYSINNAVDLASAITEARTSDRYYGSIVVIDNIPYNPLSYLFIDKLSRGIISLVDSTVYNYFYQKDVKIDNDIVKATEDEVLSLVISHISLDSEEEVGSKNLILRLLASESLQDISYEDFEHLSDFHTDIHITDSILEKELFHKLVLMDFDYIKNAELILQNDIERTITDGDWSIEMSIIDKGVKLPSFGFFSKRGDKVERVLSSVAHPNVTADGTNYCTGVQSKNSIDGIAELSFGNLTSPFVSNVWGEDSPSVAKGFQNVFYEMLMGLDVE